MAETMDFVAYYRVSTDKQGRSGLGLDAQKQAVRTYFNGGNWRLIAEYTEIESGNKNRRIELDKALSACKKHGAKLIIAKLDRLSRNVAFIANLMDSGVEFMACDIPFANRLTLHILSAVAEHEREMISQRTKVALAAAKRNGVKLGSPDPHKGSTIGVQRNRQMADQFASNVVPVIKDIQAGGTLPLQQIAYALNARGIPTARGGQWYPATVRNVLMRIG